MSAQIIAPDSNESTITKLSQVKMKRNFDDSIRNVFGIKEPTPEERKQRKLQLKKKISKRRRDIKNEMKINENIDKRKKIVGPQLKRNSRNALQKHLSQYEG